jgi:HlyD family type I secretion membrane fusion protein
MSLEETVQTQTQEKVARPFPMTLILSGFTILAIFIVCLVTWASLAPLEGAIVSPGIISVSGHRKLIQHLEGGIVETIHVSDGDQVSSGQLLIELHHVTSSAELYRLQGRYSEVLAAIARFEAERSGSDVINFSQELLINRNDPAIASLISSQNTIFQNNRSLINDKFAVFEKKIAQTQEEINGLTGRIDFKEQEINLLRTELNSVKNAVDKGLLPKDKKLQLGQKYALLRGDLIGLQSELGRLEQLILETRVQQKEVKAQWIAELSEEKRSHESQLFDLEQQIIKAQDVLKRTRITSPIAGTVVNLQVHSLDGVVEPGQIIMEIVPANDDLIVDVFLDPVDINDIAVGMLADVRLTSVNRRRRIPMQGSVTHVSADRLTNPQTGEDYYSAHITLSQEVFEQENIALIPGMGADVFIRTGARTPFEYLLSPIVDSLQLALREN